MACPKVCRLSIYTYLSRKKKTFKNFQVNVLFSAARTLTTPPEIFGEEQSSAVCNWKSCLFTQP